MHPKDLRIQDFNYHLPDERIARYPLDDREAAKLLLYQDGAIAESTFHQFADYIPEGSLFVLNETKVVPARLQFKKQTGGLIEIFCLEPHSRYADVQTAMQEKNSVWWRCMVGGASKWKGGTILTETYKNPDFTLSAVMTAQQDGLYTIQFYWTNPALSFAEILHHAGKVPLPPYLRREAEASDRENYQTVYASKEGSVAAPTAGLHFTEKTFAALEAKNIHRDFVTLHVGAGTFKPVKAEKMADHDMHAEWIEVSTTLIRRLLQASGKIVGVGTTTMRTLESLYWIGTQLVKGQVPDFDGIAVSQWLPYEMRQPVDTRMALEALLQHLERTGSQKLVTRTQIIIAPGYQFRLIDGLVTNFHQPQSTLLLLVSALIGDDWRKVYDYALNNDYRFLSYGDGSLLWRRH